MDTNYLLTYYENIAIACNNKVANEGIIKDMMKGSLIDSNLLFKDYIAHRRRQSGNKLLWLNLTNLADQWHNEDVQVSKKEPLGK